MDLSRLINNAKRIMQSLQNIQYKYNENAPVLTREQYSALNIGAVNAEQNQYYYNCLETEPDKGDVKNRLYDY